MRQADIDIINALHPKIRKPAALALADACNALTGRAQAILTSGYRSFSAQQIIYDQGRTTKGEIVTNAKPGQGFHNYGVAIDGALLIDGRTVSWDFGKDFDGDHVADWLEVAAIFKGHGFSWGGDWKSFKDYPHFEMTFGHTWQDLFSMYSRGKFIPGTNFVSI